MYTPQADKTGRSRLLSTGRRDFPRYKTSGGLDPSAWVTWVYFHQ